MRKKPKQLAKPLVDPPSVCRITTEGIDYVFDWDTFPIHGFVFMRCVATDDVVKKLKHSAMRCGVGITTRIGIRNGYWGVGLWRTR